MSGDAITLKGFAWQINVPPEELTDMCERVEEEYKTKVKTKQSGGTRRITRCFGRLRVVHKRILNTYLRDIEWPDYVYGIGKGRGPIENARAHQGKHHHFLTDVRDFYPSTQSNWVHDVFVSVFNFTPRAAQVATRLTTLDGGLPQGIHPSTHLSYLAFRDIDRQLNAFANRNCITYTRYGDDLSFSAPTSFQSKVPAIKKIVNGSESRYTLHEGKKTYYKQGPVEITGVRVLNNEIVVPERFKDRLERLNPSSAEWEGLHEHVSTIEAFPR